MEGRSVAGGWGKGWEVGDRQGCLLIMAVNLVR